MKGKLNTKATSARRSVVSEKEDEIIGRAFNGSHSWIVGASKTLQTNSGGE